MYHILAIVIPTTGDHSRLHSRFHCIAFFFQVCFHIYQNIFNVGAVFFILELVVSLLIITAVIVCWGGGIASLTSFHYCIF
jgi:hypothetical protein